MSRYGSGMGLLDPCLSDTRRPVWDKDGTRPLPDAVCGRESRSWDLIGDGASPIPVPYRPSVLEGEGSRLIPDKVLGSGMPVAPSPTHTDPFHNPKRAFDLSPHFLVFVSAFWG
jgi:hypothetical protein